MKGGQMVVKLWSIVMLIFGAWFITRGDIVSVGMGLLFGLVGIACFLNIKVARKPKTKTFSFSFLDISPEAKKELEGLTRGRRE